MFETVPCSAPNLRLYHLMNTGFKESQVIEIYFGRFSSEGKYHKISIVLTNPTRMSVGLVGKPGKIDLSTGKSGLYFKSR